jgi:hypothetical protein
MEILLEPRERAPARTETKEPLARRSAGDQETAGGALDDQELAQPSGGPRGGAESRENAARARIGGRLGAAMLSTTKGGAEPSQLSPGRQQCDRA